MADEWQIETSYTTDGKVIVREWMETAPNIRIYRDKKDEAPVAEPRPKKTTGKGAK